MKAPTVCSHRASGLLATAMLVCCSASAVAIERTPSIEIGNDTGASRKVYFMVVAPAIPQSVKDAYAGLQYPCSYPTNPYSGDGNALTCHMVLPDGTSQDMPLTGLADGPVTLAVSAGQDHFSQGPCNTTLAELTLNVNDMDSYDISLVNGRSFDMVISSENGQDISLSTAGPRQTLGVYPAGCSRCVDDIGVAPAFAGNGTTTQNCPGYGRPPGPMPAGSCKTGPESDPVPNPCGIDAVPAGGDYSITFRPAA